MAGPSLLKGVFFTESDGVPFVELGTVFRRAVDETHADRALKPIFTRMGFEGEMPKSHFKELVFRGIRGQSAGRPKAAADGVGFCLCVRELDQETIDRNAEFFRAIASKLECGASLRLVSRHARIALSESASVVVVEKEDGVPRMVLYSLLRSYGVVNPRRLLRVNMLQYYKDLGAWRDDDVIPNSTSAVSNGTADDEFPVEFPDAAFDAVDDWERQLAAQSKGVTRGVAAWDSGRPTWLIDLPLVVLTVNRLRTPAARQFKLAALYQSMLVMSGDEEIASGLARYWQAERTSKPDNDLLCFLGGVVTQKRKAAEVSSSVVQVKRARRSCELWRGALRVQVTRLETTVDALSKKHSEALDVVAKQAELLGAWREAEARRREEEARRHSEVLALSEKRREEEARRHSEVLSAISGFAGQLTMPLVLALGRFEARVVECVKVSLVSQTASLCGHIRDVVEASITSPTSHFLKALRASVRGPSRKGSPHEAKFPSDQKRGEGERALHMWLNLTSVVERELTAEQAARRLPLQSLGYDTWRTCRSRLGKALKADRLRRRGSLPPEHQDYCARPLLWDRIAGGEAYVLAAAEEPHVLRVLRRGKPSILEWILGLNASEHGRTHGPDPWPLNRDDLLHGYDDEGDERAEGAAGADERAEGAAGADERAGVGEGEH
jgi:hypothetical protein